MTHSPVHRCECPLCQSPGPHPDQAFHHPMKVFPSRLNEPQRRWFTTLEVLRLGHRGKHLMAQITGMSPACRRGAQSRIRASTGNGAALETAGAPIGRRPKAKRSSTRAGLRVKAILKRGGNELGERVSNEEMRAPRIEPHAVCPAWNYTINPRPGDPDKIDQLIYC